MSGTLEGDLERRVEVNGGPQATCGEVMIRFNNVTKVYGNDTVALERINLEIGPGEFVFLVGPAARASLRWYASS